MLEEVILLDVLEVLVGVDLQFAAGGLVGDDEGVGVELEGADGPHVVDGLFDAVLEGAGLVVAVDEDHDLLRVHHGGDADGEGGLGDFVYVIVEKAAVGDDGVRGEGLLAGAALEAGAGLVEGDVAVGADAAHEEVDAAGRGDGLFIVGALSFQVRGVAVQDMDVLFLDIDVAEEVVPHKGVVALRMLFRQVYVLIHVERNHVLEGNFSGLVQFNQFPVHSQRGASGRATQFERLFRRRVRFVDTLGHVVRSPFRHPFVVGFNN